MVCTAFRGLDRRPGASNRSHNKSWHWGWHDERNLSSDRWPRLSIRKARKRVLNIDGNSVAIVAAMCSGDRVAILDDLGTLHCGGHTLDLYDGGDGILPDRETAWQTYYEDKRATINPGTGVDASWTELGGLTDPANWDGSEYQEVMFRVKTVNASGVPSAWEWKGFGGDFWDWEDVDITDYGITVSQSAPLTTGWSFQIELRSRMLHTDSTQLIRMGAYVLIAQDGIILCYVDAVRLSSGETMVAGSHYGAVRGRAYLASGGTLTLTLCDIEGKAYSGVVVSATEPIDQEGYWLNTGGNTPKLMEWSVSQTTWIHVSSTYIKIATLTHDSDCDNIRKGDAVVLYFDCDAGTDPDVKELLNSNHYLYDADIADQGTGWIVVSGVLPSDTVNVSCTGGGAVMRDQPQFDFITEAQNRLWGCRYSEEDNLNEIYASKLGDFRNWDVFQGLSTDSWRASRGTPAPFTGAITLGGNPLFFREEWLEKVFPSASGAHQIQTYSLEGVQKGSSRSLVIIDERLYYKSRLGVCVYTGTLPTRISEEFLEWKFRDASAARHRDKYDMCATRNDGERLCMVYDTRTGDWHAEDVCWDGVPITWRDDLYYTREGILYVMDGESSSSSVEWYAESDEMSLELPEHKWIKTLRLRYQLELGASFRVYVSYDGGPWERKADLHGNRLHSAEAEIWPRRCDHFRLRLEGKGGCEIQSISYRVERSQGGR